MAKFATVEEYIQGNPQWEVQLKKLRYILNKFPLEETIKWGAPVYVLNGKNLIGMAAFKNHYSLWFFEGVLLTKNKELLINAQEGKTKSLRQIKLFQDSEIPVTAIKECISEIIELSNAGIKVKSENKKEFVIPSELKGVLKQDSELNKAFSELSNAKQRDYCEYIFEAKKEETKQKRLEKIIPMIKMGSGLNDSYK